MIVPMKGGPYEPACMQLLPGTSNFDFCFRTCFGAICDGVPITCLTTKEVIHSSATSS